MTAIDDLPGPEARGVVVLVSGGRGAGKSTLLTRARQAALDAGLGVGGMISLARVEGGTKTGIDVMDAGSGVVLPLARYRAQLDESGEGMGTRHYAFDAAGIEAGLRWAEAGRAADVFIVDELGPLEYERGLGWAAVIPMIAARAYGCALVTVRPELIEVARARLGVGETAPVLMVEAASRDGLAAGVCDWIRLRANRR